MNRITSPSSFYSSPTSNSPLYFSTSLLLNFSFPPRSPPPYPRQDHYPLHLAVLRAVSSQAAADRPGHRIRGIIEALNELHRIAVIFEEKIYNAATSQAHPAPTINSGMSAGAVQPQNPGDPASVESTAQTGPAGGVDWQEEIYQKIISMKELYYADLSELYHWIVMKLQQHDALMPPEKLSDQYDKMKYFKIMLERTLAILKLNKGNIQVGLKDKLPLYEKQMVSILASHKKKPPQPQGPHQQSQHSHSMAQQQPSQVAPMPMLENQMNQLQLVNMQPTANTMQQAGGASVLQPGREMYEE